MHALSVLVACENVQLVSSRRPQTSLFALFCFSRQLCPVSQKAMVLVQDIITQLLHFLGELSRTFRSARLILWISALYVKRMSLFNQTGGPTSFNFSLSLEIRVDVIEGMN